MRKICISLGILAMVGCSSSSDRPAGAGQNEVGIVSSRGEVLFYAKEANDIIIKNYDLNKGLDTSSKETCEQCVDTANRISIEDFKGQLKRAMSLDRFSDALRQGRAIDTDVDKLLYQIRDLKKFYGQPNVNLPTAAEIINAMKSGNPQAAPLTQVNAQLDSIILAMSSPEKIARKGPAMQSNDFMYTMLKNFAPTKKLPCGLNGSPADRANDCAVSSARKNTWELIAISKGMKLITRTKELKEVWRDTKTGLIWGDKLPKNYAFNDLVELDKSLRVISEKVCPTVEIEHGGLNKMLRFRLPTLEEFKQANQNGIRSRLPNMNDRYWTSSVFTNGSWYGWVFDGSNGESDGEVRDDEFAVRCVAQSPT